MKHYPGLCVTFALSLSVQSPAYFKRSNCYSEYFSVLVLLKIKVQDLSRLLQKKKNRKLKEIAIYVCKHKTERESVRYEEQWLEMAHLNVQGEDTPRPIYKEKYALKGFSKGWVMLRY